MRITIKALESKVVVMNEKMKDDYRVTHYQALGNRKNYYYVTVLYKNGEVIKELESKKEMWKYMNLLMEEEVQNEQEGTIFEIAENEEMSREERMEEIAKQGTTETEATRIMYISEDEDLTELEGTIVSDLGLHWADMNDKYYGHNGGYDSENFNGVAVILRADSVRGYKISYYSELWAEDNNKTEEEREEMVNKYQSIYDLVATDEDNFNECEILVSSDTEFYVESVFTPNDETNYWEVYLERVK